MSNQPSSRPMQLGFIGGALDSAVGYVHFTACRLDNRWALVSGCFSMDPVVNRSSAQTYGVDPDRVYDEWTEFLLQEKNRLDAVVVLTPTPSHFEIVTRCLEEGVPVICEKALAVCSAEIRDILKVRDKARGFLAVTYNYSGYPMVRELRALIERGELGVVRHFHVEMPQEGFARVNADGSKPKPQAWRLKDGTVPTIHLDLAVHLHQLLHYLTGAHPLEVVSDQRQFGWFDDVVDHVTCLCRYSGDVQGQMWFSKSALGHRNGLRIRIYGSAASAEWFQMEPERLAVSYVDGRHVLMDRGAATAVASQARYTRFKSGHPAGFIEAFANLYMDIEAALRDFKSTGSWKSQEVFGAELALEALDMCEAMVESAKTRSWNVIPVRTDA